MRGLSYRLLLVWLTFVFWTGAFLPFAAAQELSFRHISIPEGLPSSVIFRCVEDSRGIVWFCTNNGLARFDGTEVRVIDSGSGLPGNAVWNAAPDGAGGLYLGAFSRGAPMYLSSGGGLSIPAGWDTTTLVTKITYPAVDRFGTVWYCRNNPETVYRNGRKALEGLPGKFIQSSLEGGLYLCEISASSFAMWRTGPGGSLTKTFPLEGPPAEQLIPHKFVVINDSALVFLQGSDLMKLSAGGEVTRLPVSDLLTEASYMIRVSRGRPVVIGTAHSFVLDERFQVETTLAHPDFVPGDLMLDSRGNFWFATLNDGVYFLPRHAVYARRSGSARDVVSFFRSRSTLYAADSDGRLTPIERPGRADVSLNIPATDRSRLRLLASESLGDSVYLLLNNNSVHTMAARSLEAGQPLLAEVPELKGAQGLLASGRRLYVPVMRTGMELHQGNFSRERLGDRVFAYYRDRQGRHWFGTRNGLMVRATGDSTEIPPPAESVPWFRRPASGFTVWGDSLLWVVTDRNSAYAVSTTDLTVRFRIENTSSPITCLKPHGSGGVLLGTAHRGLALYDLRTSAIKYLGASFGLGHLRINDVVWAGDSLLLATSRGLVRLSAQAVLLGAATPTLIWEQVSVAYRDTVLLPSYRLPHFRNSIELRYLGLDYAHADLLEYEFAVNGGPWERTAGKQLLLSALAPGAYDVSVRAVLPGGVASPAQTLHFLIESPWWKRPAFRLAAVFAGMVLLAAAWWFSRRRFIRRAHEQVALAQRMARLEMDALQAQMNPHFIHNTLYAIQSLMDREDKDAATDAIGEFAHLVRRFMESSGELVVSVSEEADLLGTYFELQKLRFGDQLAYRMEVDRTLDAEIVELPASVLQPLVENAIKHGRMGRELLVVEVRIDRSGSNDLHISVCDNGPGMGRNGTVREDGFGKGLEIVRKKLDLFGASIGKTIHFKVDSPRRGMESGTCIHIVIEDYL